MPMLPMARFHTASYYTPPISLRLAVSATLGAQRSDYHDAAFRLSTTDAPASALDAAAPSADDIFSGKP